MEKEIDIRMIQARTALIMKQPFLGAIALTMEIIPRPGIETMATDGTNCFYDPALLDQVSAEHVTGILAEEAYHKAKKHHIRRKGRDPKLWNIACDYQIHNDLLKDGFKFPDFLYHDPQYDGLSAEDIYHLLYQKQQEQKNDQPSDDSQSQTGDNEGDSDGEQDSSKEESDDEEKSEDPTSEDDEVSGDHETDDSESDAGKAGAADQADEDGDQEASDDQAAADIAELKNVPRMSGLGMILDPVDEDAETEVEIAVSQALGVAKRALSGAGGMPECMLSTMYDLKVPRKDWREELRRFADPSCRKDYTWRRPNRRFSTADFFLPGYISDGVNHMGIVIDGSGSVNEKALQRGISECQGMLDCGIVDRFTVLYCDTDVYNIKSYENGDQIELLPARRGGTLFAPAFKWFENNVPDVSGLVYFTDMFACDWPDVAAHERPTLWAAYGDPRVYNQIQGAAPFGELIEINYD